MEHPNTTADYDLFREALCAMFNAVEKLDEASDEDFDAVFEHYWQAFSQLRRALFAGNVVLCIRCAEQPYPCFEGARQLAEVLDRLMPDDLEDEEAEDGWILENALRYFDNAEAAPNL